MAVFTELTHHEVEALIAQLKAGEVRELAPIGAGIENTNYFVTTSAGSWVLTVFERLTREQLPFYLRLMQHLARRMANAGSPVLNVMFHSSEAIVGGSPYNRTTGELDAFLERLAAFLRFAVNDLGAVPVTLGEFHSAWTAAAYAGAGQR